MRIALNRILEHLKEKGADEEHEDRARRTLPALVETREYADTLHELGVDVDALTSADIAGPDPDHINPEETGPVADPTKAQPTDPN